MPTETDFTTSDRCDPARAEALAATLNLGAAPPFVHLVYFWDLTTAADLGSDGHPRLGNGMIPDLGLLTRMWAGGRLRVHRAFRPGVRAERVTRLLSVTRKEGRTGKLAFVTLRHDIRQASMPVLTEEQDLVYREAGAASADAPAATEVADERRALKLDAAALFRYSALTFNAHRIHYDADYCRDAGYGGVVVHGPLLATMLAAMAGERGQVTRFSFRATSPLLLGEVAWLCRAGARYWVEGPRRRVCMTAEAA